jgi:short-subunit dehydrogenase
MVASRPENVRPAAIRGISAERVAQATYRGYRSRKREVVVPWSMIPVIKLYQLFPAIVEWILSKALRKVEERGAESKEK